MTSRGEIQRVLDEMAEALLDLATAELQPVHRPVVRRLRRLVHELSDLAAELPGEDSIRRCDQ